MTTPPVPAPPRPGIAALASRLAAGVLASILAAAPAVAAPAPGLPAPVAAALRKANVPAEAFVAWVREVDAPQPRLAWRADEPVNPASLMKLVTTAAGLELLGPAFSWTTSVWLQGTVVDGVLHGDLVVRGQGDPTLVLERLWLGVRRLRQSGLREIRGDLVIDRSAFVPGERPPAEFDGEPYRPYNVAADALLVNFGSVMLTFRPDPARGVATIGADPPLAGVAVDATVPLATGRCEDWRAVLQPAFADPARIAFLGSFPAACGEKAWPVAYADPKRFAERALLGMWLEAGGRQAGGVRDGRAPPGPPTFEWRSPTLAEVVRDINKQSNNVMAQQLFLTIGAFRAGTGTPETGRDAVLRWLGERIGADAARQSVVVNGSGLSRDGRLSAHTLGRVLQSAWSSPVMAELMSSLPVAGVDGTLRRSAATPGRAHLKTGSLRDVVGVAGWVLADSGRRYVVVAIVNHASANAARPALEALADWVADDGAPPPVSPRRRP